MQQHYLMNDQTLFKDPEIFEYTYTPDTISYRDTQLMQLASALQPALHGMTPINTILRGPPGTGKTTCVRRIFREIEGVSPRVITIRVNCESEQTPFRVFATIFRKLFRQQPLLSGIPTWRLTDKIATELIKRKAVLIVCLDDANYLDHNGQLDAVLRNLLRMYEGYPGVKIGVVSTISTRIDHHLMHLDPSVLSVYQPQMIPFSPYGEEEVRAILYDRVRAGLYSGVVSSGILDLITRFTMETGDIRVGIDLLKLSAGSAERAARTRVLEDDVRKSFPTASASHIIHLLRSLKPDDERLLSHIAAMKRQNRSVTITSGSLFDSFRKTRKISYTAYHNRLKKLAALRLISLKRLAIKGNTREVVLRFDPDLMTDMCRNETAECVG